MTSTSQSGTSPLERSRTKSGQARDALAQARGRVDELDVKIGRNAARSSQDEAALQAAIAETKRLKKAIKDAAKERQKLLTSRKRATAAVAKAEEKAHKAEAKYDRAVLADMIQREKEQDRESSDKGGQNGAPVALPSGPTVALPSGASGTASGMARAADSEPEDLGTATARTTAARTTAAKAAAPAKRAAGTRAAGTRATGTRATTTRRATSGTTRPRSTASSDTATSQSPAAGSATTESSSSGDSTGGSSTAGNATPQSSAGSSSSDQS